VQLLFPVCTIFILITFALMKEEAHKQEDSPALNFLSRAGQEFAGQSLQKIVLSGRKHARVEPEKVSIRPLAIRGEQLLSFVYRYPTRDITRNHNLSEGLQEIERLLQSEFNHADMFTAAAVYYLKIMKSGKQKLSRQVHKTESEIVPAPHDRASGNPSSNDQPLYLYELGITGRDGHVKKERQHKYRQMNHYVRLLQGVLDEIPSGKTLHVADMGCGKGYLTFALYDFLVNTLQRDVQVTGVEQRPELVTGANRIASECGFAHLSFTQGQIGSYAAGPIDMLVALHACDTATDEAIWQGIRAGATVIVVAPCCHKQIRKELKYGCTLEGITRHGILLERQAELLTDSMRALLLEMNGYRTRVFEFIETEHTPKNLMITAVKVDRPEKVSMEAERRLKELKETFGIGIHCLEKLLAEKLLL
jgi:protein-L-isoaspartate O-methyltransferase